MLKLSAMRHVTLSLEILTSLLMAHALDRLDNGFALEWSRVDSIGAGKFGYD